MTAADEHYMVDVTDEELLAFLAWHKEAWHAGKFRGMTIYSMLKMAWMAARNSLPEVEFKPSRNVLPPVPAPLMPLPGAQVSTATLPDARMVNGRPPLPHTPDPFAAVKLSGPQQAALDSLYPVSGVNLADPQGVLGDMPVVGPVEDVRRAPDG